MIQLLVLADDFTGALDTGIKFADSGIKTKVISAKEIDFSCIDETYEVLVMDLQTRHLPFREAYSAVYRVSNKARIYEIPYILKKTDSALRGNISAELTALLDATHKDRLLFIPALPDARRTTVNGHHLIDGVPVNESVFAKDPFSPVTHSRVSDIIGLHSNIICHNFTKDDNVGCYSGFYIYDASTNEDILEITSKFKEKNMLDIMAGCSGLGAVLPDLLSLNTTTKRSYEKREKFITICGSVNPITTAQVNYAKESGITHIKLSQEEKLVPDFWITEAGRKRIDEIRAIIEVNSSIIISTFDDDGQTLKEGEKIGLNANQTGACIAKNLGFLMKMLVNTDIDATYLVTGGDTLLGFMEQINTFELDMITEIMPGCVLSNVLYENNLTQVISKSGGFGKQDLFVTIEKLLIKGGD